MKKIFSLIFLAVAAFGLVSLTAVPVHASNVCDANVADAIKKAAGCEGADQTDRAVNLIVNIINWVMGIIAIVAVIVIIIAGIQFMTSNGDPGKVKKAKDAILYAVIGLIVIILAATIVNLVIGGVSDSDGGGGGGSHSEPECFTDPKTGIEECTE